MPEKHMTTSRSDSANKTTGSCYTRLAHAYAASVDARPWNAYYERPAMLSVLPPLAGKHVLDAGCGPGWYAEYFADQGAVVTAVDLTPEFVALTQARLGNRATVFEADLAQPLAFAADSSFDLIVCPLVLHYIEDWEPVFREFARALRPCGQLVFSTHHPFMDWQQFATASYFTTEQVRDTWDVGPVTFYRRSLTTIS